MVRPVRLSLSFPERPETWRDRWRAVRDLLGGALVLAVWLSLWSWVAVGVLGPLSQATSTATPTETVERT